MEQFFFITHDREFLKHFLTRWRTLSISPEMVERLRASSKDDPYAAYGYGRWLSLANPGGDKLKEAEILLTWAGANGNVQDANAALAELYYEGRTEADKAMPEMHAFMMDSSYKLGSELAQFETLEHTIYGEYGYPKNPAEVADILRGHIEKNPYCDPIYYDLWGQALEKADLDGAEKAYQTAISRGETEAYYSLASLYKKNGLMERSYEIAREGASHGAVNCHRFKAGIDQEDFLNLPENEQKTLHEEIESELNYAIEHNDRYACFQKGAALSLGELGFVVDYGEAMKVLKRGGELGDGGCYSLIAAIQADEADTLPSELKLSAAECAKISLQSVRLGDGNDACLETVVKAYVIGQLPQHEEEIEKIWLKKYQATAESADDAEDDDQFGVLAVYPQGFYYAMDVELSDDGTLDLEELATKTGANRFDIVHFSPLLNRLSKVVPFADSFHIAMLVDRDSYAKELPDNMPATIIYGQGSEILGPVIFVLEHNDDYGIVPMNGIQKMYSFLQMLNAATRNIIRQPSNDELRALGAEVEEDEEVDG